MKLSDFSINPSYVVVKNVKSILDNHASTNINKISKYIDMGDIVDTTNENESGKKVIFKNVKLFNMNNVYYGVVNRKDIIAFSKRKAKISDNIF